MKVKVIYLLLAAALVSCDRLAPETSDEARGNSIVFSVSDQVEMKSSVESLSDLVYNASTNPNAHVYVWATKDDGDLKKVNSDEQEEFSYCNKELFYNSTLGLWDITGTKTVWECNDSTHAGCTYNFSAYGYRGTGDITAFATGTAATFGKSFTIVLPQNYSFGCGTDYLLSNITPVTTTWNGSAARGKLVNLHMEHALASVRVVVKANADIHKIGIQGIQIKDFYRGATMQCTSQATYGQGKNKWTMTLPTDNAANYIFGDITKGSGNTRSTISKCEGMIINKTDDRTRNIMEFIAVPQDPSTAVLTIAYLVQEIEGASEHQVVSSWNLADYDNWEYGVRNVYTITIDTSNSLYATIDDWKAGNSVTGVVLP